MTFSNIHASRIRSSSHEAHYFFAIFSYKASSSSSKRIQGENSQVQEAHFSRHKFRTLLSIKVFVRGFWKMANKGNFNYFFLALKYALWIQNRMRVAEFTIGSNSDSLRWQIHSLSWNLSQTHATSNFLASKYLALIAQEFTNWFFVGLPLLLLFSRQ